MTGVAFQTILLFVGSLCCQLFAIYMLPATRGFTDPVSTLLASVGFIAGLALMARMIQSGVDLSILLPLLAAAVPLGTIAMATMIYGESVSTLRISLLVLSCGIVGYASTL